MRRLIWGFAGRTYHIVGNLMSWLICNSILLYPWTVSSSTERLGYHLKLHLWQFCTVIVTSQRWHPPVREATWCNTNIWRSASIFPQNALRRDCNGKCIEWIDGHYLEVVVEIYTYLPRLQLDSAYHFFFICPNYNVTREGYSEALLRSHTNHDFFGKDRKWTSIPQSAGLHIKSKRFVHWVDT